MLKALTFIGLGKYEKTTYVKHDDPCKTCHTDLFPEAVAELYEPDKIIAFVTPKVKSAKQDVIEHLENKYDNFCTNDIPNGNSPKELWKIFEVCADAVDRKDNIILDITHAFRSIPLLVFIVSAYLRQVKNVQLKHIFYGAYEARNISKNESPIFDLTPFVSLLDWTNAVNIFQRTGDARPIAALDIHSDISDALTKLSESLFTNRTIEVQEAAFKFNGLPISTLVTSAGSQAPFRMLIEQLQGNYRGMAVNDPHNNPESSVKKQYEQIKWYIDNQHYLQAITLIREWLVSWEYIRQHPTNPSGWRTSGNHRKPIEDAFNIKDSIAKDPDEFAWDLWDICSVLRNDLAHCGMRIDPPPKSAEEAIQAIMGLFDQLQQFVEKKGAIPK